MLDLGDQPVADRLVDTHAPSRSEPTYPLELRICERCWLLQLREFPGADGVQGHDHASGSVSETVAAHDREWAVEAVQRLGLTRRHLVVDVASGDGSLLREFAALGPRILDSDLLEGGRGADLVVGNHNLAHAADLDDAVAGMRALLAPEGTLAVEFHHARALVGEGQFDIVCHPHRSYLSLLALQSVFRRHRLRAVHAEEVDLHGGSVRVYAVPSEDPRIASASVERVLDGERRCGLDALDGYSSLSRRAREAKAALLAFLRSAASEGRSVVGYGAPGRAGTLLNYCGVTTELLAYTVDAAGQKQGRLLPGCRIPVHPPSRIFETKPDFVLVLAWSLADEILRQMAEVRSWGGRFVVAVPELKVLS